MDKEYFVAEERDGVWCFCPVEFHEDRSVKCVRLGENYIASLDTMKKRAKKIWKVDSVETLENSELIYDEDDLQEL